MPRPNTPVIPPGWAQRHRPVVDKTLGAHCTIRKPGGTGRGFDAATGATTSTPYPPYLSGACRVQNLASRAKDTANAADQVVTALGYQISLTFDAAGIAVGDLLRIDAVDDNSDPAMVNREFTVRSIPTGSLHWQRVLICTDV